MRPLHNILLCTQETDPRQDLNEKNKTRIKYIDKKYNLELLALPFIFHVICTYKEQKMKEKNVYFYSRYKNNLMNNKQPSFPTPLKTNKTKPLKTMTLSQKKTIPYELLRFYCCLFLPEKL